MNSKISVIICCYRQAHFLQRCIDSVLAQTYTNYEIVVVDDGSPDNVEGAIESYQSLPNFVFVKNSSNRGLGESRNRGVLKSSGDWLFILDSDDTIEPTFFEVAVGLIENDKTVVYSDANVIDNNTGEPVLNNVYSDILSNPTLEQHMFKNHLPVSLLMSRREYDRVGGYPEDRDMMVVTDWDMSLRLLVNECQFRMTPQKLWNYYRHEDNMTNTMLLKFSETVFKKRHAHTLRSIAHRIMKQILRREPLESGLQYCMWGGLCYSELVEGLQQIREQEKNK